MAKWRYGFKCPPSRPPNLLYWVLIGWPREHGSCAFRQWKALGCVWERNSLGGILEFTVSSENQIFGVFLPSQINLRARAFSPVGEAPGTFVLVKFGCLQEEATFISAFIVFPQSFHWESINMEVTDDIFNSCYLANFQLFQSLK